MIAERKTKRKNRSNGEGGFEAETCGQRKVRDVGVYATAGQMIGLTTAARARNRGQGSLHPSTVAKSCTFIFQVHSDSRRRTIFQSILLSSLNKLY